MEIHLPQLILLTLLLLSFIVQLVYLFGRQNKLNSYSPAENLWQVTVPVSVVISARNEAVNLTRFLPTILEQDYPEFEVVVVNDCSLDESDKILEGMQQQYPNLRVVIVSESQKMKTGKKFALTMGIKAAKYDHLLFTDADCEPSSKNWITRMAAGFESGNNEIVLGYGPYTKSRGLLGALIRYETIRTAINYLSAAMRKDAYMGVGRNLAYRRDLFFNNKGFASHMHISSGDDDLFVNENATRFNTTIEVHPDAFMYSEPKSTFADWYAQKRRHMTTGKLYKKHHKRMLAFEAFTGFAFYILVIACLFFNPALYIALGALVLRWLFQFIIYQKQFSLLEGRDLLWGLPFLDLLYYFYMNIFGLIGNFTKANRWK